MNERTFEEKKEACHWKIPWYSVRFRITIILCVFLLIMSALFINYNYYAIHKFQKQIEEYNYRILTQYMGQIDINMGVLDNYLSSVLIENEDLWVINGEKANINKNDQILAAVRFTQNVSKSLQQYYWLHSLSVIKDGSIALEIAVQGTLTTEFKRELLDYVQNLIPESKSDNWKTVMLGGHYYVIHIFHSGQAYVCAVAAIDDLMVPMELLDKEYSERFFLVSQKNEIVYMSAVTPPEVTIDSSRTEPYVTGEKEQFGIIQRNSEKSDLQAVVLYKRNVVQSSLAGLNQILFIIVICVVLIGAVVYGMLKKMLLNPLKKLQYISNDILLGNLESRLSTDETVEEFSDTYRSINKMLDRIHTLRINIYEEQFANQQLEIEKLQQQIKPHFLLNSFNLIYSMAQEKDYDLIQQMSLSLSRYFRYRVNIGNNLVPLQEEIECVKNYLNIQKFRYEDDFEYDIKIEDGCDKAMVVPLMIQTFAENSIVHAIHIGEKLMFSVTIYRIKYGSTESLCIEIEDTGKGYPEEIINAFKRGDQRSEKLGIGINNVRRRLQLIYGNQARILLSNSLETGGARIKIITPIVAGNY